jgi:hypothetical protein
MTRMHNQNRNNKFVTMSGNTALPIDYASQNEEWILIHDQLHDEVMALYERSREDSNHRSNNESSGNDGDDNHDNDAGDSRCHESLVENLESLLMAARIGRLANIQAALLNANNNDTNSSNNSNSSRNSKSYSQVLEQYLLQTQYEFDNDCHHQPLIKLLFHNHSNNNNNKWEL